MNQGTLLFDLKNRFKALLLTMPHDPAHHLNRSERQADFTYTMTVKTIKIQDTGKGRKPVENDLHAVLRKIEEWHGGSIATCSISYRDKHGPWHQISWDGEEAAVRDIARQQ